MGLLRVFVREAEGLKNTELLGKSDPYAKVVVASRWRGEVKAKTVVKKNDLNPKWKQMLVLKCALDTSSTVRLRVLDEDIGKDDVMGAAELPIDLAALVHRSEAVTGWRELTAKDEAAAAAAAELAAALDESADDY